MKKHLFWAALGVSAACCGEVMDRPQGIKIGQRMTLKPYVSLSYVYDSNIDSSTQSNGGSSWQVNPGVDLTYMGENWELVGAAWYGYHAYSENSHNLNQHSYGESLGYRWSNCGAGDGRGWSLSLHERLAQISQDDDMSGTGGRGIGRDRLEINVDGALERRFNEYWHANVNGGYYYLDYNNDDTAYAPMYGWTRWMAGAEAGFTASKWTDLLLAASYQGYSQKNNSALNTGYDELARRNVTGNSRGVTVQGGVGSYATERISYRALVGWSHFDYGEGAKSYNGPTYTVSGNWKMTDRWQMMLLASSYYQPSESSAGSASRVDSVSWGLGHAMVRSKLNATFDVAYRHQTHESILDDYDGDYTEDILTGRLGCSYAINRFVGVFGNIEYQTRGCDGGRRVGSNYDYDRWRLTVGMRLTY